MVRERGRGKCRQSGAMHGGGVVQRSRDKEEDMPKIHTYSLSFITLLEETNHRPFVPNRLPPGRMGFDKALSISTPAITNSNLYRRMGL